MVMAFAVPAYLVVVNVFKGSSDIVGSPLGLPVERLTLSNVERAFAIRSLDLRLAYAFTGFVTVVTVALVVMLGSMLSYWIARRNDARALGIHVLLLAGLMVPPQAVVIPVVKVLAAIGLLNSPIGLLAYDVAIYLPLATFVYVGFVRTLPRELEEAAAMDGAGPVAAYWHVVFPLLTPASASLSVLLAVFVWNDFLSPSIILGPTGAYTITTGVYRAVGLYSTDWGLIFTFVCLASAPMILLFLAFQRFIVSGLTGGALKG